MYIQAEIPLLNQSSVLWNQEPRNTWIKSEDITNICHKRMRLEDGHSWHTGISTSEKIWRMPLTHFIHQSCHLCRPTENVTLGRTRSKADGVTLCWNTTVCMGTSGSLVNDLSRNISMTGRKRRDSEKELSIEGQGGKEHRQEETGWERSNKLKNTTRVDMAWINSYNERWESKVQHSRDVIVVLTSMVRLYCSGQVSVL